MGKSKKSKVWQYFEYIDADILHVTCKICFAKVARGGTNPKNFNTSNMRTHLQSKHTQEHKKIYLKTEVCIRSASDSQLQLSKQKPMSIGLLPNSFKKFKADNIISKQIAQEKSLSNIKKWDIDHPQCLELNRALGECLAIDILPYSFVENLGFLKFLRKACPMYKVPRVSYFENTVIPNLYNKLLNQIKTKIMKTQYVSITTVYNNPFLRIAAHWCDKDFFQRSAILRVVPIARHLSDAAISEEILKGLDDVQLKPSNIHVILKNNAESMVVNNDASLESIGCFIHSLQLCIQESFLTERTIIEMLAACRQIATYFHESQLRAERLLEIQQRLKIPEQKLLQDTSTKWNSTYDMLERILEQKEALALYCCEYCEIATLTNNQIDLIKNLVVLFRPFNEIENEFRLKSCTLSSIIPTVLMLKIILKKAEICLPDVGSTIKELQKSIEKRFNNCLNNKILCLSTFLDPRFKLSAQINEISTEKITFWIVELIEEEARNEINIFNAESTNKFQFSNPQHIPEDTLNLDNVFKEMIKEQSIPNFFGHFMHGEVTDDKSNIIPITESLQEPDQNFRLNASIESEANFRKSFAAEKLLNLKSSLEVEINKYLSTPLLNKQSDPFSYWKVTKETLPNLQKLALKHLSAPASSAESENLFINDEILNRPIPKDELTPKNADMLMFLHYNLKIFNFDYD